MLWRKSLVWRQKRPPHFWTDIFLVIERAPLSWGPHSHEDSEAWMTSAHAGLHLCGSLPAANAEKVFRTSALSGWAAASGASPVARPASGSRQDSTRGTSGG
jgi:hypothetical protein